jgi:hypothetical protein
MKHINRPINFKVAALFAIICALALECSGVNTRNP